MSDTEIERVDGEVARNDIEDGGEDDVDWRMMMTMMCEHEDDCLIVKHCCECFWSLHDSSNEILDKLIDFGVDREILRMMIKYEDDRDIVDS